MMNFADQRQSCHSERSEESPSSDTEILRCAQNDNRGFAPKDSFTVLPGKVHQAY
jgi:hypothetical protein